MTIDARKRRARRIAADEAHAWARNLRLGNFHAKAVLSALTLYVDGDGFCFVAIPSIADDTELSPDTVRRRLVWLEEIGAVVRHPQWIDEKGCRNGDGRGKRTTDLIRLLTDADHDAIEARARGENVEENVDVSTSISPSSQQGLNPPAEAAGPAPALGQPLQCGEGLISEPEPESSPQPPSRGSVVLEGWKEFQDDWQEPILRQSIAQDEWARLSPEQRQQARQAARGYVVHRKAQKKPPNVISAHLFLRERDAWPGFAKLAPDAPPSANPSRIRADSAAAKAIRTMYVIGRAGTPLEIGGMVVYPKEVTPRVMAFAEVDWPTDRIFVEASNQIASWGKFFETHIHGTRGALFVIGPEGRRGIWAPRPWPPKKDGSWSTGDPDTLMTEEDYAELK